MNDCPLPPLPAIEAAPRYYSNEELIALLVTLDGKGKEAKLKALQTLIADRDQWKAQAEKTLQEYATAVGSLRHTQERVWFAQNGGR